MPTRRLKAEIRALSFGAQLHIVAVTQGEPHPSLGLSFPTNWKGRAGLGGSEVPNAAGQGEVGQSTDVK